MSLTHAELNAEIHRIETAIVARELRVRERLGDLSQRIDEALPKAVAAGVAATAVGLLLLWLRPRPPAAAANSPAATGGLMHWVSMAWPLLPLSLRAMIDLRLISALGTPLLAWLKGRKERPPQPPRDTARTRG